jgi:hypothetical protein
MKGEDLVLKFGQLCAVNIKILPGCSVPWATLKKYWQKHLPLPNMVL